MFYISALGKLLSVKKCLDEMCGRDNELAVCRWKMIHDFEHPSVFVFEEMCLLWVSALLFQRLIRLLTVLFSFLMSFLCSHLYTGVI
jgi:hypothetical protein